MPEANLKSFEKIAKFDSTLVDNMEILSSMDNYYKWIGSLMRKYAGRKVLDFGCGNGNLTPMFLDKEIVVGLDYSKNYVKMYSERFKGSKNVKAVLGDATDKKAADELKKYKFDTIITMNTLEHIKNDQLAFNNAYRILEKGGRFIIIVPAMGFLYSILDYEGGHFRRYTVPEIAERVKKAGFKIKRLHYFNLPGALGWYLINVLMKKRIYSQGTFNIYNSLVPLFKAFENVVRPPFGLSVFCVAEKI